MSEIIHRLVHPPQTMVAAQFIAANRKLSYNLEPDTAAYAHMVHDIMDPQSQQYQELDAILQGTPDETFVRAYSTNDNQLALLGLGRRGKTTDPIVHLFAKPEVRRLGLGSMLVRSHRRWAERDQSSWVLASNPDGLAFWQSQQFQVAGEYFDKTIGLRFINMERQKRRRKAA